jgi:hypothetical protein
VHSHLVDIRPLYKKQREKRKRLVLSFDKQFEQMVFVVFSSSDGDLAVVFAFHVFVVDDDDVTATLPVRSY